MQIDRNRILVVSILVEGFLAILFFAWAYLKDYRYEIVPSLSEITTGLIMVIPLLLINALLFGSPFRKVPFFKSFRYLKDRIVKPLADELGCITALAIAIFAGVGEELFFRGLCQLELGMVLANVLFALLHFGVAIKQFFTVAVVYFGIGMFFSYLTVEYHSLWVPIITHATYDYLILIYMKYWYKLDEVEAV